MVDLTPMQEEAVASTVGAIQRIAMAIVELPTERREAHYAIVTQNSKRHSSRSASKARRRMRG